MNELSKFYPQNHFGANSKEFFNEHIHNRAVWYRQVLEVYGEGKSGTSTTMFVVIDLIYNTDKMVTEIVSMLSSKYEFEYSDWFNKWEKISLEY